ncbi:hypothetical protein Leryth_022054 [Lithospermum erythrorhizon]|uniref:Uncharacterized protein n=1 Tax=Lithospermum erythrorhizon TaxID=34254 RepID=A0AAV3QNX9_LITER|nr:hypothetical protein Leryth_022054 [Lithospermum erythrorhizon]
MGPCTRARNAVSKSRKVDTYKSKKNNNIHQFQSNISSTRNPKIKKTRSCLKKNQEKAEEIKSNTTTTPPLSPVKSYNTNDTQFHCLTPKSEKSRIPEITTCPPAPKKRRIIRSGCSSLKRTPISFYATPELDLFFLFGLPKI